MLDIPIFFFNTKGRQLQEFKSQVPGLVRYYSCGPTVYNYPHIGNMFSFTLSDLLRRLFTFWGYKVVQVMNITDVGHLTHDADMGEEDRIMKALGRWQQAKKGQRITVQDVIDYYTAWFVRDLTLLNIKLPTYMPFASHHVKEMQDIIKVLLKKGFAYKTPSAIYYDVSKFKDYNKLYPQALNEKLVKAREEVKVDSNKKHPADFRLWQLDQPNHIMQWDTPWGKGFPGWHIECSAMSMKYLGQSFDIHTGGVDHIPLHHTNEIAQSEACTNQEYANYWLHNQHVKIHGEKMAKSLGNFATLQTMLQKGYKPWHIRMFFTLHHYRSVVDFNDKDFEHAVSMYRKFSEYYQVAKWRFVLETKHINKKLTQKTFSKLFPEINDLTEIINEYNQAKGLDESKLDANNNFLEKYLNKIKGCELPYVNFLDKKGYTGQIPKETKPDMLTYRVLINVLENLEENGVVDRATFDLINKVIQGLLVIFAKDLATPQLWSKTFELLKKYYTQEPIISLVIIAVTSALTGVLLVPQLLPVDIKVYSKKHFLRYLSFEMFIKYQDLMANATKIRSARLNREYNIADMIKKQVLSESIVNKIIDMPELSVIVLNDNIT